MYPRSAALIIPSCVKTVFPVFYESVTTALPPLAVALDKLLCHYRAVGKSLLIEYRLLRRPVEAIFSTRQPTIGHY